MHKRTLLTAGFVFAVMGTPVVAGAETLEEALASAYLSNPTLLAERAKLRAQDELVPQALSNWRPSVSLTGSVGPTNVQSNANTKYDQTYTQKTATASISQPLYRGGQTVAQTEQAEAQVQAERAQLVASEQTVLLNVVTAYMDIVQYQATVELNRNNEQVLQRQLDATNDRFRVGEVTRTDVAQSESRLSAAHADRTQAEGNLKTAKATYVSLVGHDAEKLAQPTKMPELPASVDQAKQLSLQTNPQVLAQQFSYQAAQAGVDLAFGKLLPQLSLNGTATKSVDGAELSTGDKTSSRTYAATLNLTVPIYQQGAEYSALRQQKHVAGQALTTLDQTRRDAVESTTRAWEGVQTARARIISYTDQIRAAQVALDGVRKESQVGSRTVLDVLNAEQEALQAQVNLVQAQHDEAVAEFTLKSAVGQLTAQALGLSVETYDPVKHYDEVRGKWIGTSISPSYGEEGK
ncbi:MAG TPA: TolC family outer membrane protein [Candidatus Sulfotelmatobacter sp.]|jgi:outer membrane protein|nr:TolC family outer membrane protein [Candidatus Sulfotelmatobacter sp.]